MNITDEGEKIREFLLKPGYQMQFRHALYTTQKLKDSKKEKRKSVLTCFTDESQFLLRRTTDPGFYRFVKKEEINRGELFWSQIKELGYLILLDLLHPENATPTQAAKKPKNSSISWVTDRQLRRIRNDYPEIFFTPSRETKKKIKDKRFSRYSTVFSDMSNIKESDKKDVMNILLAQDAARLPYNWIIGEVRAYHANLRMVDPDDIAGLQRFWEYQKKSLRVITSNFGRVSQESWLIPHIEKGSLVLEHLYQLIEDAIALRWYRTIKSKDKKARLLHEQYLLKYSKEDAVIAVKQNLQWFQDPVKVVDYIFRGAVAYTQIGKYDAALFLYEECLKQISLEKEDEGLCYHNLAIIYRMKQKPRKYLIWLNKALTTFKELENLYNIGITWSFIAEAYYLLNKTQKSNDAINQSKKVLSCLELSSIQKAEAYLHMADFAYRMKNRALEREAIVLALAASSEIDDPQYILYFNQRLIDLDIGKDTLNAEKEPGKVNRPPLFKWHKEGSEVFIPISPQSSNVKKDIEKDLHT